MARCKPIERGGMLIPVMLHEQIQPGTFEFALDHLVDHELDLSTLDARFNNDEVGASAYDPRVMLKLVRLAHSRSLISSRKIEQACEQNVLFMALSGASRPSFSHIARFVRELGTEVHALFTQVLMICDRSGLIGKTMFAIDGVKLPANASKERSGTHAELAIARTGWRRPQPRSWRCTRPRMNRAHQASTSNASAVSTNCGARRRPRATSWPRIANT